MKNFNFFKRASLALTAIGFASVVFASTVSAIPYNGDDTVASPVPAFNVFSGVPSVGNEADFLRARAPSAPSGDVSTPYVDPLATSCANGQRLQFRVYVHNGASASANGTNGDGPSVAHGTKVSVTLPTAEASSFSPSATISSTNAGTVNDGVSINCNGKVVKLKYIAGSASAYSKGTGAVALSDAIVSGGVPIKSEKNVPDGDVLGCWDERVYVILSVQVEEVVTPPPSVAATCELLGVEVDKDRKLTINQFKYSNTNATVKNVTVNWGDNTPAYSTSDASTVIGQMHQYDKTKDETYNVSAVVTFAVTGKADIVSGGPGTACVEQVTFSSTKPPVVTPPVVTPPVVTPATTPVGTVAAPTRLVNTGPGTVLGLFAVVSVIGAVAHRFYLARRFDA